jgi:hydrophobe/amphiphile efflux-3 (HAE3) family protein
MPTPATPTDESVPPTATSGIWPAVAGTLGRRTGVVAVVAALITVALGFGITKLEFTTGQNNYLNSDSQVYQDNVAYQSLFGGQAMISVFTVQPGRKMSDLFTAHNVAQFRELQRTLDANRRIESVITPLTAIEWTNNLVTSPDGNPVNSPAGKILLGAQSRDPDPASKQTRLADSLRTLQRINAVPPAQRTFANPAWIDFLLYDNTGAIRKSLRPFFPKDGNAQMVVRLQGNASIEDEGKGASAVEDAMRGRAFDNAAVVTTGAAVLLRDINDYLRGGFLTLGGIGVLIMAGLLLAAFAVRWRLLPLGVVAVGLVWAFGLAGYLGIPLSVVTIAGLPILLGVGIDFAVQLHARIEEEAQLDRASHPVAESLKRLMPALVIATVAAVLSFLALELDKVPMIRDFGTLLALGLPVIVVATVLLTTASLAARERRRPTPPKDYTHGPLGRITVGLGALPRMAAIPLILLSIVIFIGGVFTEDSLKVQTDPQKWVNQHSRTVKNIDYLSDHTGANSELGVYVQSQNIFDTPTVQFVDGLARQQLARHPRELYIVSSLVTTVSFLMEVPKTTLVPPTGADVQLGYSVAPPDIQRSAVNLDAKSQNLVMLTAAGPLDQRAVVVHDIRDTAKPPAGVRATPAGLAVVGTGLLENINANRVELTYYALLAVFVFLLIRYRNVAQAVLSMVPVLVAVGLTSLVAWAADIELSPLTAVSGPLVIALCTEFTSLIMMRHLEERRRGRSPRDAVDETAARTGRAFMVSAMAAVIGILVLAFSTLPLLRDFGLITALNVGVALLSALIVLPPLLTWADERGWIYRGGAAPPTPAATGMGAAATPRP